MLVKINVAIFKVLLVVLMVLAPDVLILDQSQEQRNRTK
jgi:hypothetical protein